MTIKQIVMRLVKMQREAEAMIKIVSDNVSDGDVIGAPLYNVKGSIHDVIGGIVAKAINEKAMEWTDDTEEENHVEKK